MKASSFLILLLLQCSIVFSQTLQPDVYEPNNTMNNAFMIDNQAGIYGKIDSLTANFNNASDTSDWYKIQYTPIQTIYNPLLFLKFSIKLQGQFSNPFPFDVQVIAQSISDYGAVFTNDIPPKNFSSSGNGTLDFTYLLSMYTGLASQPSPRWIFINIHHPIQNSANVSYKFYVIPQPLLSRFVSFSPTSGEPGTKVKIIGKYLFYPKQVEFNNSTASFVPSYYIQSLDDTTNLFDTLTATVPAVASSGRIAVNMIAGNIFSTTDFIVTKAPAQKIKDSLLITTPALIKKWSLVSDSLGPEAPGNIMIPMTVPSKTTITITKVPDNAQVAIWHESSFNNTKKTAVGYFSPGFYNVSFWNETLDSVKVAAGYDTHIRTGVLDLNSKTTWKILNANKKEIYHLSLHQKLLLPIGIYYVVEGNSKLEQIVSIKDGAITGLGN